ncbi:MAG: hypothetical protein ACK2UK_06595 [Candidatus Promineifilaceae bacterium]
MSDLEPQRAQNVLRRNLSTLNKALDGQWLLIEGDLIGLNGNADVALDVDWFLELAESGRDHEHDQSEPCDACLRDLADAALLYRADFLAGFGVRNSANFDNWQDLEREHLQRELAAVLERLVRGYSLRRDYDHALVMAVVEGDFDPRGLRVLGAANPRIQTVRIMLQTDQTDLNLTKEVEDKIKDSCLLTTILEGTVDISLSTESS